MANLLFLAHRLPFPPNKGDKVRSYHLLKELAREHRVFLGTFIDDAADERHISGIAGFCADVHVTRLNPTRAKLRSLRGLLTGEALTLPYYWDKDLAQWIGRVVTGNDIRTAVVFSSAMAQYIDWTPRMRVLVDFIDVDSAKWTAYSAVRSWPLSWVYRREGKRLLEFERRVAARADRSFFVTAAECALFLQAAPECRERVEPIGNGVDTTFFAPDASRSSPYPAEELPLVFTGAMDYWPNIDAVTWFAADVMPRLRALDGRIRFYVVGMRPTPAVRGLSGDAVVVTGSVADVRPYLQHAALAVAPLRVARGIQNKVLEAMAMSRAVVTTRSCANAIEAATPRELAAADDAEEFVASIQSLLTQPERASAMGAAARRLVVERYSWESALAPLKRWLNEAVPGQHPCSLIFDAASALP